MSTSIISTCANCGKEGSDVTNTCNKCKEVMYCNAACKKKHRHKHKKECERRVAELHDETLFKQPPPLDDCPICFLRMPMLTQVQVYMECCGKLICDGCIYAVALRDDNQLCPFCRAPVMIKEEKVELNDAIAIRNLGVFYDRGLYGLAQNRAKALEYWHRAAKLGSVNAYHNIGNAYYNGNGVEVDKKKANQYYELAAMSGDVSARYNLGVLEKQAGNVDRTLKHYMIAVEGGSKKSLENIKVLYTEGYVAKDDYAKALRSYQAYLDDIKSEQRDQAAADGRCQYYE